MLEAAGIEPEAQRINGLILQGETARSSAAPMLLRKPGAPAPEARAIHPPSLRSPAAAKSAFFALGHSVVIP